MPLVVVGENNSGKSNLISALDLIMGESWPGNHSPEDHEFFERDRRNEPVEIVAELQGVAHADNRGITHDVTSIAWRFASESDATLRMHLDNGDERYVSNTVRDQCMCILIAADRRLAYQMSYASKFTFLSKLMRRFHERLTADPARVALLQNEFEQIKRVFNSVDEFSEFASELQSQIADFSGNLTYGLDIDFSAYDPSNFFHALKIQPHENGAARTFEELGTGQEQILALSFAYAYAKAFRPIGNIVLIVEEPEAHLHPLAQEWLSRKLRELAGEGIQIVITTHSPAFVDIMGLDGLCVVRKVEGATRIIQLSKDDLARFCADHGARATPDTVLPFYSTAVTPDILSGLFARKVVLTEGPTESFALPTLLNRVGLDVVKEGIAVIPVHGVGNLAKWWRFFSAYGIPVYPIFDNDASEDQRGARRSDLLSTVGVPVGQHSSFLESTELVISPTVAVFGGDFETVLRAQGGEVYSRLEAEAAQYGLTQRSKPLVARYAAERLRRADAPDLFESVEQLRLAISAVGSRPPAERVAL